MSEKRRDNKGRILREGESQRKNLTYMYRYTDENGNRQTLYAPTLKDLREKEDCVAARRSLGMTTARSQLTAMDIVNRLLSQKQNLRYQTVRSYENHAKNFSKWSQSGILAIELKTSMAKEFMLFMEANGYSYGTISNTHHFLKEAFALAVEDDILIKNPFIFNLRKVVAVKSEKRKALTPEQTEHFLAYIRNTNTFSKKYNEILVLLHTGMRVGELCGLTINDIDWERRRIHINKQLIEKGSVLSIGPPKSEAGNRIIPMDDVARDALMEIVKVRKTHKVEPIVDGVAGFLLLNGNSKLYTSYTIDSYFRRMQKAYNKKFGTDLKVTPHILRHTFCTNLVRAGVDLKSIQYLMGHSKVDISLDTYTHFTYDDVEAAFNRMHNMQGAV